MLPKKDGTDRPQNFHRANVILWCLIDIRIITGEFSITTKEHISKKNKKAWVCARCRILKQRNEFSRDGFYVDGSVKYYGFCKTCKQKQAQVWYGNNVKKVKDKTTQRVRKIMLKKDDQCQKFVEQRKRIQKKYRQSEQYKEYYLKNKLKKYNLTVETYNKMFVMQNGQCAICFTSLKDIPSKQVHIDHYSKGVRGILCSKCNQAIGLLKHNVDTIKRAAEYLKIFGHD